MSKTTFALIGTGIVGERIINQIRMNKDAEIVGIYDENRERMVEISMKYGLPATQTLEELLSLNPHWVYIGTPPISHAPLAEKIAERGINILSEKPLAHDREAGEIMVRAANDAGVQTAMHFPLMYSEEVLELKRAIEQKELGKIVRIELHTYFPHWPRKWQQNPWIATREQGGFIREVFPHFLQLAHHLFGDIEISSHSTSYPEDSSLCETGVVAIGDVAESIPLILNGLAGIGLEERLDFKVFGTDKVMTLRNWSELWISEKDQSDEKINVEGKSSNLIEACCKKHSGEEALIVSFEEGLKVQKWIDKLLG